MFVTMNTGWPFNPSLKGDITQLYLCMSLLYYLPAFWGFTECNVYYGRQPERANQQYSRMDWPHCITLMLLPRRSVADYIASY